MEMSLSFTVPGRPRPKQRPRWDPRHKRVYTPHETAAYEKTVAAYALRARQDLEVTWPLRAEYRLAATAYLARPWPDADNIIKLVGDALNGILWDDDRQVKEVTVGRMDVKRDFQHLDVAVTAVMVGAAQLVIYK